MIVRISGEGQFDLADSEAERLNELEQAVVAAVEAGDEDAYTSALAALIDHVRAAGSEVPDDALEPSQVILPPSDTTLAEAAAEFSGEGLIPD
jgi:23S rRNA A2030 N6-methylase RlmJ